MKITDLLVYLALAAFAVCLLCVDYLNRWHNTPERMRPTLWRHFANYFK